MSICSFLMLAAAHTHKHCVERRIYFIAFEITQIVHSNLFSYSAHACRLSPFKAPDYFIISMSSLHSPQLLFECLCFSHNSSPVCRAADKLLNSVYFYVSLNLRYSRLECVGVTRRRLSTHSHAIINFALASPPRAAQLSSGPFVSSSRHPGPVFLCFIKFFAPQSHTFFLPSDITRMLASAAGKLIVSGTHKFSGHWPCLLLELEKGLKPAWLFYNHIPIDCRLEHRISWMISYVFLAFCLMGESKR